MTSPRDLGKVPSGAELRFSRMSSPDLHSNNNRNCHHAKHVKHPPSPFARECVSQPVVGLAVTSTSFLRAAAAETKQKQNPAEVTHGIHRSVQFLLCPATHITFPVLPVPHPTPTTSASLIPPGVHLSSTMTHLPSWQSSPEVVEMSLCSSSPSPLRVAMGADHSDVLRAALLQKKC